jgi:hypothetical protein
MVGSMASTVPATVHRNEGNTTTVAALLPLLEMDLQCLQYSMMMESKRQLRYVRFMYPRPISVNVNTLYRCVRVNFMVTASLPHGGDAAAGCNLVKLSAVMQNTVTGSLLS